MVVGTDAPAAAGGPCVLRTSYHGVRLPLRATGEYGVGTVTLNRPKVHNAYVLHHELCDMLGQLRSAVRRGARYHPAARDRVQPRGRARGDGPDRALSAPRKRRKACSTAPPRSAPGRAWPRSACAHQTSTAPPTSPCRAPSSTRPRSPTPASAGCSTTPSMSEGHLGSDCRL
jgi:hypothetical protein